MPASSPIARCAVLIPALNPPEEFHGLIEGLLERGFLHIVVVDDGSDSREPFESLGSDPRINVLRHASNCGKGAALKTGFSHIIQHLSEQVSHIVTADADGQHLPGDIVRIAESAGGDRPRLVLGVRQFDNHTPLRSALGNRITRRVLSWLRGVDVQDSQTGLRALPLSLANECLGIRHNHYEFELECLLRARDLKVGIREVPIATVYLHGNADSHFRPLVDSMRIYLVFARFVLASIAAFLVDILLFAMFIEGAWGIFAATYVARGVSASFNFLCNKYLVFRSRRHARIPREMAGYAALVVVTATASGFLVSLVSSKTAANVVLVKVAVDSLLFLANFVLQRCFLFSRR